MWRSPWESSEGRRGVTEERGKRKRNSQGHGESELSNVGVIFPKHSEESHCISLLSIDSGSELRVVLLHGMEISQEIPLLKYSRIIMPWDWGSSHPDCSGCPINQGVRFG